MQQLQIGTLAQLKSPAYMPYDHLRAGLLIHDKDNFPIAADIAEAIALQLLTQHGSGNVTAKTV